MLNDSIRHFRTHPPRYVKELICEPLSSLREKLLNEYGQNSSVFGIRCHCGNETLQVGGTYSPDDDAIFDFESVYASCPKCGEETVIFDPRQHGYDGEMGNRDWELFSDRRDFCCPKCSEKKVRVTILFQYSGEYEDLDDELITRREDFFGWCAIGVQCTSCNAEFFILDQECA